MMGNGYLYTYGFHNSIYDEIITRFTMDYIRRIYDGSNDRIVIGYEFIRR